MTIYPAGALNLTAMIVPDLAVVVLPPNVTRLSGVPSNGLGIVGSAEWGPKNSPVIVGSMEHYASQFGSLKARKYDMGTQVAAAVLQGANNFRCVRVTDGTDAAATIAVQTNCITFTSKYTGSLANADTVRVEPGKAVGTFRATVLRLGRTPEVFDNIGLGLTGAAIWAAMADAINLGQSGQRGPSDLIVATAGVGVTAPATATYTLAGGADGAADVDSDDMVGVDTAGARTGMYALRGAGATIALLADCDTVATWTTQVAFGLAEGIYMIAVAAAGIAISNGSTGVVDVKAAAGIDSYAIKILHGDWCYFNDAVNGQVRLISPQGFVAGRLANSSPEVSSLNKPLYGIVGTQKSRANQVYSAAELQALGLGGVDVITNPVPGGHYFGARFGRNASSNPTIHQDPYTRVTHYIAATLNAGMGLFVGVNATAESLRETKSTLDDFLDQLAFTGMIGNAEGTVPFSTQCDTGPGGNNPQNRLALGIRQADVRVQYLSVTEYLIVNLQGGQSVTINRAEQQVAA